MTTMNAEDVTREPYTVRSSNPCVPSRLPMANVTSIVFVVDDDVSVRESLELLIKSAGWQPELFASARDFLSHPRPTVPCCLVLDVSLPGLNGLELQQQHQRSDRDADHLHHRPRRRAHDRASDEGRRRRVPDEALQGR